MTKTMLKRLDGCYTNLPKRVVELRFLANSRGILRPRWFLEYLYWLKIGFNESFFMKRQPCITAPMGPQPPPKEKIAQKSFPVKKVCIAGFANISKIG